MGRRSRLDAAGALAPVPRCHDNAVDNATATAQALAWQVAAFARACCCANRAQAQPQWGPPLQAIDPPLTPVNG